MIKPPAAVEQRPEPDEENLFVEARDDDKWALKPAFMEAQEELTGLRSCERPPIGYSYLSLMCLAIASPFDLPDVDVELDVAFSQKIDV